MRHRQSRRQARAPPGQQHRPPATTAPAHLPHQPDAQEVPRLHSHEPEQLDPPGSQGPNVLDADAPWTDNHWNARDALEPSLDSIGLPPSQTDRSFESFPFITVFPPSESATIEKYPSQLSSLDTGSGAEEYERISGAAEVESYHRPPSRERRSRSEVIRTPIYGLEHGSSAEVQLVPRARSVSDAPPGRTTIANTQWSYINSLGPPDHLLPGSSKSSVIFDGGEQQAQKLRLDRGSATSPVPSDSVSNFDHSSQAQFTHEPRFELQKKILASFQRTRNYHGQNQKFLPQEALHSLVNTISVTRELQRELGKDRSLAEIQGIAEQVCTERTVLKGSKLVTRSYRKIFAILVLVGRVSSIVLFLTEVVSDLDLPLHPIGSEDTEGLCRRDENGTPTNDALGCFEQPCWSPVEILNFQDYQWKMLAPFFAQSAKGDVKHYALQDQHILPFPTGNTKQDEEDQKAGKTGGFGKVFMVRIHKEHHNFKDDLLYKRGFAIKQQLDEDGRAVFEKEIAVLKKFSGSQRHKHIVSLLATYEQFRKLHLVFYRAECDLKTYWSDSYAGPLWTPDNVKWMIRQCAGVAGALLRLHRHLTFTNPYQNDDPNTGLLERLKDRSRAEGESGRRVHFEADARTRETPLKVQKLRRRDSLHEAACSRRTDSSSILPASSLQVVRETITQYGRHGDINPGNILWFKDSDGVPGELRGTLKLADFGQAELNSLKSRTSPRSVAHTLTYRPPECDRLPGYEPLPIRQTYDMWCLGCVFLEFVAWMLGGEALLEDFAKLRFTPDYFQHPSWSDTYFQATRNPKTGRMEVTVKLAVTQFIKRMHEHQNCSVVFHDLLNMIQWDMLVPDSNYRASCEDISGRLSKMLQKCSSPKQARKNPWKNDNLLSSRPMVLVMTPDLQQAAIELPQPLRESPRLGSWESFVLNIRGPRAAFVRELQFHADSTRTIMVQGQNGDIILMLLLLLLDTLYRWIQSWW